MVHDTLLDAIDSSAFRNLLESYGFRKVFDQEYENDGRHTQYIIGFESPVCRTAVFYQSGGSIALIMGRLSDSFDPESISWPNWVDLNDLIAYLDHKPIESRVPRGFFLKDIFRDYLNATAGELEPRFEEVIKMFSENTDSSWRELLKEYRSAEINRRFQR